MNQTSDEAYRGEGLGLAGLRARLHASRAGVYAAQEQGVEAFLEASTGLYFTVLHTGPQSVQSALSVFRVVELGVLAGQYKASYAGFGAFAGFEILREALQHYYSSLVLILRQLAADNKLPGGESGVSAQKVVREFNKAEFLAEEKRIEFLADVKEAGVQGQRCLGYVEKAGLAGSAEARLAGARHLVATATLALARFCIQEGAPHVDFAALEEATVALQLPHGDLFVYLLRLLLQ